MLFTIAEAFLEHQTIFFGVAGGLAGVAALVVLRAISRAELFAKLPVGTLAAGLSKKGGWLIGGGIITLLGLLLAFFGSFDPISGTAAGLPKLACDHHSRRLVLFIHGWRGDPDETGRVCQVV